MNENDEKQNNVLAYGVFSFHFSLSLHALMKLFGNTTIERGVER